MSYDCEHTPKCVNQRHHVSRFYTERDVGKPTTIIGGRLTLRQRFQAALGDALWRLGCRLHWPTLSRAGWDLSTLSWGRGHVCKCGVRSRTEREHLTHDCDPDGLRRYHTACRDYDA